MIVATLALGGTALAQADPTIQERVFAQSLARRLGAPTSQVERVRHRTSDGREARGVKVELPGLTAERLRFRSPEDARAYARSVQAGSAPGVVEVRGDQVLVLQGERLSDASAGEAARDAGWEVLPAPASAGEVRRLEPTPVATPTPTVAAPGGPSAGSPPGAPASGGETSEAPTGGRRGAAEMIRHHLSGEELRPLQPGSKGRLRLASSVAAVNTATMGAFQRTRVLPAYDALSPADQARFDALMDKARSRPEVQAQLVKALASSNSVDDIAWLAKTLDGKTPRWIAENTRLTSEAGPGIKQQFHSSCVPTTMEALRGEYDPVYALRTRLDNPDITAADDADATKTNPRLADEQRIQLEAPYDGTIVEDAGYKGKATARAAPDPGAGTNLDHLANKLTAQTGMTYVYEGSYDKVVPGPRAVEVLKANLAKGRVIPFAVTDAGLTGSHAVLATSMRTDKAGEPTAFLIHDPWHGRSAWVPVAAVKDGTMDLAGWNQVAYVLVPQEPKTP